MRGNVDDLDHSQLHHNVETIDGTHGSILVERSSHKSHNYPIKQSGIKVQKRRHDKKSSRDTKQGLNECVNTELTKIATLQ